MLKGTRGVVKAENATAKRSLEGWKEFSSDALAEEAKEAKQAHQVVSQTALPKGTDE